MEASILLLVLVVLLLVGVLILLIIDDPHSEQDALSPTVLESHYEWYTSGPRQRLQPGGAIVLVMTRWSVKDLTGKLLEAQGKDDMSDQWEIVEFPAVINDKPMWGNFWSMKGLMGVKASIPLTKWQRTMDAAPTSEEGALIKREWWQTWEDRKRFRNWNSLFSPMTPHSAKRDG
jgi:hypothetical protein